MSLLRTGQSRKGAAFGPMADVVMQSTQHMHEEDLRAIAVYLQSLPPVKNRVPLPVEPVAVAASN